MTFVYVSRGRQQRARRRDVGTWERKDRECAALSPLQGTYVFRLPDHPNARHQSRTWYRVLYAVMTPLYPLLKALLRFVTTTERVGRHAQCRVERILKVILENRDIDRIA
jgi:hypothetical protein